MLLIVKSMVKICRKNFGSYANCWHLRFFRTKYVGNYIRGFTVLEVLVAIFVITVGVLAAFNAVQNISASFRTNASRLTATYLAQEGVELIRNKRDTNWLDGSAWNNIDMSLIGCEATLGRFTRTCTSTLLPGPPEKLEISVGVSWQERGIHNSVTSTTELYKWQ